MSLVTKTEILKVHPAALSILEFQDEAGNITRHNPRTDFEDIEELAESIRVNGLQTPLLIQLRDGQPFLIGGERRYKALMHLIEQGHDPGEVRAIPVPSDADEADLLAMAMIENDYRPLKARETLSAYSRMLSLGFTEQDIAEKFGVSIPTVRNRMKILNGPEDIRESYLKGEQNGGISLRDALNLIDAAKISTKPKGKGGEVKELTEKEKAEAEQRRKDALKATEEHNKQAKHTREKKEQGKLTSGAAEKLGADQGTAAEKKVWWQVNDEEQEQSFLVKAVNAKAAKAAVSAQFTLHKSTKFVQLKFEKGVAELAVMVVSQEAQVARANAKQELAGKKAAAKAATPPAKKAATAPAKKPAAKPAPAAKSAKPSAKPAAAKPANGKAKLTPAEQAAADKKAVEAHNAKTRQEKAKATAK